MSREVGNILDCKDKRYKGGKKKENAQAHNSETEN